MASFEWFTYPKASRKIRFATHAIPCANTSSLLWRSNERNLLTTGISTSWYCLLTPILPSESLGADPSPSRKKSNQPLPPSTTKSNAIWPSLQPAHWFVVQDGDNVVNELETNVSLSQKSTWINISTHKHTRAHSRPNTQFVHFSPEMKSWSISKLWHSVCTAVDAQAIDVTRPSMSRMSPLTTKDQSKESIYLECPWVRQKFFASTHQLIYTKHEDICSPQDTNSLPIETSKRQTYAKKKYSGP